MGGPRAVAAGRGLGTGLAKAPARGSSRAGITNTEAATTMPAEHETLHLALWLGWPHREVKECPPGRLRNTVTDSEKPVAEKTKCTTGAMINTAARITLGNRFVVAVNIVTRRAVLTNSSFSPRDSADPTRGLCVSQPPLRERCIDMNQNRLKWGIPWPQLTGCVAERRRLNVPSEAAGVRARQARPPRSRRSRLPAGPVARP